MDQYLFSLGPRLTSHPRRTSAAMFTPLSMLTLDPWITWWALREQLLIRALDHKMVLYLCDLLCLLSLNCENIKKQKGLNTTHLIWSKSPEGLRCQIDLKRRYLNPPHIPCPLPEVGVKARGEGVNNIFSINLVSQGFWRLGSRLKSYMESVYILLFYYFWYLKTSLHLLQCYRKMMQHCFVVTLTVTAKLFS